jgi:hypothetical protein
LFTAEPIPDCSRHQLIPVIDGCLRRDHQEVAQAGAGGTQSHEPPGAVSASE